MKEQKIHQTIWTPDNIRGYLISKYGRKYAEALAEKSGMSRSWVSRHISGTLTTAEGRYLLASEVNAQTSEIWPDTQPAAKEMA